MDWISENKEWFFSGLGVTIVVAAFYLIRRLLSRPGDGASQYQRTGSFSNNTQIGSINVRDKDEK